MTPVPIERSNRLKPKPQRACAISITRGSLTVAQIAQANDTGQIAIGDVREIENNRRAERLRGDAFRGVSGRPYRAANGGVKGNARESPGRGAGGCPRTPWHDACATKRRAMRPVGDVLSLSSEDGGCALACKRRRDKQGWSAVVRDPFRMGAGDTRRIERLCGTGCLYMNKAF